MRFAEHMLMESKFHGLTPYVLKDDQDRRCALGLVGGENGDMAWVSYPWLSKVMIDPLPCGCKKMLYGGVTPAYELFHRAAGDVIVHLFNEHVMDGVMYSVGIFGGSGAEVKSKWTMEQLADWIESIDPTPRDGPLPVEEPVEDEEKLPVAEDCPSLASV